MTIDILYNDLALSITVYPRLAGGAALLRLAYVAAWRLRKRLPASARAIPAAQPTRPEQETYLAASSQRR